MRHLIIALSLISCISSLALGQATATMADDKTLTITVQDIRKAFNHPPHVAVVIIDKSGPDEIPFQCQSTVSSINEDASGNKTVIQSALVCPATAFTANFNRMEVWLTDFDGRNGKSVYRVTIVPPVKAAITAAADNQVAPGCQDLQVRFTGGAGNFNWSLFDQ